MLTDVKFRRLDSGTMAIINAISSGTSYPQRIERGLYLCRHWNFSDLIDGNVEQYPLGDDFFSYGVCDSPEQFMTALGVKLEKIQDRKFVVSFVEICRDDQPESGGWRWHKWGPYIGLQDPVCEYIFDEPVITKVYTYSVNRILT